MKFTVFILLGLGCIAAASAECGSRFISSSRVIGGKTSKQGQWPWQAALSYKNRFFCGGTLIHPRWVLTAAHCIFGKKKFYKVTLGELDRSKNNSDAEQFIKVKRIIKHQNYSTNTLENDIALIQLTKPIMLKNKTVNTACMPAQGEKVRSKATCFVSGWGKTSHPGNSSITLQHAKLKIIGNSKCSAINSKYVEVTDKMLCAGTKGIQSGCHGDSGGPFVCLKEGKGWTVQGVVSWGSPSCNSTDAKTVFTRVGEYRDWIDQYVTLN